MSKRVFKEYIGNWPKIYDNGSNVYEVVATYKDARKIHRMMKVSYIPSCILAFYLIPQINGTNWGFIIPGAAVGCTVLNLIVRSILTDLPFLINRTTSVIFENGKIRWGKDIVSADMARQFRTDRHRNTAAELRTQSPSNKTFLPIYQFSSEVFIDTGPGWMHPRVVAEIARDESGAQGHLLMGALRFVDSHAAAQATTAARNKARVSLD